jgi:hypothetical protein
MAAPQPAAGAEGGRLLRRVEAKYAGRAVVVDIAETASVAELRQTCARALNEPAACLTLLCAGHKLNVESAAVADVLPAGSRLMLLSRGPAPPPRLTIVDSRRGTSAYAMEVPFGLSVAELITLARQAVGFPISVFEATLFSTHLKVFMEPGRPVSSYDLPTLSEACLLAAPPHSNAAVPRVSSLLRGQSNGQPSRLSPLAGPPSPPVNRTPAKLAQPSAQPVPAWAPLPAAVPAATCLAAEGRCAAGGLLPRPPIPVGRFSVDSAALPTRPLAAGEPDKRRYVCSSGGSEGVSLQSGGEAVPRARPPVGTRSRSNGCGVRSGGTPSPPYGRSRSSGCGLRSGGGLARSRSHHTLLRAGCQRYNYPIPHPPPARRKSADDGRRSRYLGRVALAEIGPDDPDLLARGCGIAEASLLLAPISPTDDDMPLLPSGDDDDDEAPLSLDDLLAAAEAGPVVDCRACARRRRNPFAEQCACKCGDVFCSAHLFAHQCSFDHLHGQQQWLSTSNAKLAAAKVQGF